MQLVLILANYCTSMKTLNFSCRMVVETPASGATCPPLLAWDCGTLSPVSPNLSCVSLSLHHLIHQRQKQALTYKLELLVYVYMHLFKLFDIHAHTHTHTTEMVTLGII